MSKLLFVIGLFTLGVVCNAQAHDADGISQLQKEIHEIKARLSNLESAVVTPGKSQDPATSKEDGWRSLVNWRKLQRDMYASDVRKILGEPHRVEGGSLTIWYYRNYGRIIFLNEKVESWSEPSN